MSRSLEEPPRGTVVRVTHDDGPDVLGIRGHDGWLCWDVSGTSRQTWDALTGYRYVTSVVIYSWGSGPRLPWGVSAVTGVVGSGAALALLFVTPDLVRHVAGAVSLGMGLAFLRAALTTYRRGR